MQHLINTSKERRQIQDEHNKINNIIPKTILKSVDEIMDSTSVADSMEVNGVEHEIVVDKTHMSTEDKTMILDELRKAMLDAAEQLKFEKAAKIRDEIIEFEKDLENI